MNTPFWWTVWNWVLGCIVKKHNWKFSRERTEEVRMILDEILWSGTDRRELFMQVRKITWVRTRWIGMNVVSCCSESCMLEADDVSCRILWNHEIINTLKDWAEFRYQKVKRKARKDWVSDKSSGWKKFLAWAFMKY